MMLRILLILFLALGAAPALADGLADFEGGEKAFEAGKYEQAIDLYSTAISSTTLDRKRLIAAHYHRGLSYMAMEDLRKARPDIEKAIRMDPKQAALHVALGRINLGWRSFDSARSSFEKAIRADKTNAEAYRYRCWAYANMGKLLAMKDCREALRLNPDDAGAYDARAFVYWLLGEEEAAKADLARARELDPAAKPWQERFKEFERKPKPL